MTLYDDAKQARTIHTNPPQLLRTEASNSVSRSARKQNESSNPKIMYNRTRKEVSKNTKKKSMNNLSKAER